MSSIRVHLLAPASKVTRKTSFGNHAVLSLAGAETLDVRYDEHDGAVQTDEGRVKIFIEFHDIDAMRLPHWVEDLEVKFVGVTLHDHLTGLGQVYMLTPGRYKLNDAVATVKVNAQVNNPEFNNTVDISTIKHDASINLTAPTIVAAKELYLSLFDPKTKPIVEHGLSLRALDDR